MTTVKVGEVFEVFSRYFRVATIKVVGVFYTQFIFHQAYIRELPIEASDVESPRKRTRTPREIPVLYRTLDWGLG